MAELAGLILAAGVSSRMGKFKPLLDVDGKSMIQRVVEMMYRANASPIVVVAGYQAELLEDHLKDADVCVIRNTRYYDTQMMDSLMMGLETFDSEVRRVLVSPADIPLVENKTVELLLGADGPFVRPTCRGVPGHPVILCSDLLSALKNHSGEGGLNGAITALGIPVTEVEVEDEGTTLDSDTRDEYAALLRYRRRQTRRPQHLQLDLRIALQAETTFLDFRCAQFLELIQTTGSMLNACQCMHMSYSKGWRMINEMERQLGYPVLFRSQGGSNGGGSSLTAEGERILCSYRTMQHEITEYIQKIFRQHFPEQ